MASEQDELFGWLQNTLIGTCAIANAAVPSRNDGDEKYGSASTHLAMVMHDYLADDAHLQQLGSFVHAVAGAPASAACALKRLLLQAPVFASPGTFAVPNGMFDVPQILATAYFGRTADAAFSAEAGTPYRQFLSRMQWLLVRVQDLACRAELDTIEAVIDHATTGDFALEPRILQRVENAGRDLMPTPAGVIAAVGVAVSTSDVAYPLGNARMINFVNGIDAALWSSARTFAHPGSATKQTLYLVHMRNFLADASQRLAQAVLPCDRVPVIAPWYANIVLGARTYAACVAHALTRSTSSPIRSSADFTLFSLLAMADGAGDAVPSPTRSLFSARSKSMYLRTDKQDGAWWVLLRATLSGAPLADAARVAERLVAVPETHEQLAKTASLLCVLMHTQAGMAIVGHKVRSCNGTDEYPVAKRLVHVVDPVHRQNAIDIVMSTYTGTCDLNRLASDDLAFTDIARQQEAWTRELTLRVQTGVLPAMGYETPTQVSNDGVAVDFCRALRSVGMEWVSLLRGRASPLWSAGADSDDATAATDARLGDGIRSLRRMGTSPAALHCEEWLRAAFDIAKELEAYEQDREGGRPLIKSPIAYASPMALGSRAAARDDEAYLRLHFRMQAENALHNSRHAGMWVPGHHMVICAWLSTPTTAFEKTVSVFARALTPHSLSDATSQALLLTPEWREEVEQRGHDSVVDAALEFERALAQYVHTEGATVVALPRHSARRARDAAIAEGPSRFDPTMVPALDAPTAAALAPVREAAADAKQGDRVMISATRFDHGVSTCIVSMPLHDDARSPPDDLDRLVDCQWPSKDGLLARIAAFSK